MFASKLSLTPPCMLVLAMSQTGYSYLLCIILGLEVGSSVRKLHESIGSCVLSVSEN